MDITKLELLVEAVTLKSFSRVAEKHSYTPSALSHIVDAIEGELGLKLLERNYNGVALSPEGEKMMPLILEIIEKTKHLKDYASSLSGRQNKLVIGCYSSVANEILPEILVKFKNEHPEIKVNVIVGDNIYDMRSKKAEICFVDANEGSNLDFISVYSGKYVAVVKDDCLFGVKSVTKDDLVKFPFIMPNNSVISQSFTDFQGEVVEVSSVDDTSIISMIKKGLGVSVLPELSVKNAGKGVKSIKFLPEINREIGVVVNKETKNPAVKKFIKFISE